MEVMDVLFTKLWLKLWSNNIEKKIQYQDMTKNKNK